MRMRKKKNGAARIAACSELLIENTAHLAEDPQYAFSEKRPLYIEIGCGKGNFACGTAAANHDRNLIAMERVADVACLALEKAKSRAEERPDNLRFLIGDAKNLNEWFPEHCADGLYLNFSDPWPKTGHAKRRLTHRGFLELYRRLLKPNGTINTNLRVKLPEGRYTVTHYRLDKSNCNGYSAWKEQGRPESCSQAQAEAVNRASVLKPWYPDEEFEGTEFSLDMQLPDYAVSLIKFTKIG